MVSELIVFREIVTNQPYAGNADVHLFLIVDLKNNAFEKTTSLGIVSQAIINLATTYGYGCFETPAISDSVANQFLDTDKNSAIYYLEIGTGKP